VRRPKQVGIESCERTTPRLTTTRYLADHFVAALIRETVLHEPSLMPKPLADRATLPRAEGQPAFYPDSSKLIYRKTRWNPAARWRLAGRRPSARQARRRKYRIIKTSKMMTRIPMIP
jgi:hypothetical protein